MTETEERICSHIAEELACAIQEVSDNFGARMCVARAINATRHIEGAIANRIALDDMGAFARAATLIFWVEEYVQNELERRLNDALDRSVMAQRELTGLRDQVNRTARGMLATTHKKGGRQCDTD